MTYTSPDDYYLPDPDAGAQENEMEIRIHFAVADMIALDEANCVRGFLELLARNSPETIRKLRAVMEDMDMQTRYAGTS